LFQLKKVSVIAALKFLNLKFTVKNLKIEVTWLPPHKLSQLI